MQNPFETGHIKNYLLAYASVVVIMILFFIASTLFHDLKEVEPKVFPTEIKDKNVDNVLEEAVTQTEEKNSISRFKLMDKSY